MISRRAGPRTAPVRQVLRDISSKEGRSPFNSTTNYKANALPFAIEFPAQLRLFQRRCFPLFPKVKLD